MVTLLFEIHDGWFNLPTEKYCGLPELAPDCISLH